MNWSLVITCVIKANTLLPRGKIAQIYSLMHSMVTKKIFCIRESCDRKNREYNYIVTCISKELIKLNIKLKLCLFAHQTPWGLLMDGAFFLLDDVHVSHLYIDCCQIPLSDLSPAIASALP